MPYNIRGGPFIIRTRHSTAVKKRIAANRARAQAIRAAKANYARRAVITYRR